MTIKPKEFSINDYLGTTFECVCGQSHKTQLKDVIIRSGAIHDIPQLIQKLGSSFPMIVCDRNTEKAAGFQVNELLKKKGMRTLYHVIDSTNVVPNENALGELIMAHDAAVDLIVAVGTGTINDICKFLSFHIGLPYIVIATAPSMDGFASIGSALITDNMKITYNAHVPKAIVCDVNIIKNAPMSMITAGLGDILGKYTCLADWKLAHIVNNEYYCPLIVEMVQQSRSKVIANAHKVLERDEKAIAAIMEALILTGIAMSFVGNSRPASGSEHHISHYWEMKFLLEGKAPVLHGTKVGVGTVLSCYIYNQLRNLKPDFAQACRKAKQFEPEKWEKTMHRMFGQAANGIIDLERKAAKNGIEGHTKRISQIERRWNEIVEIAKNEVPEAREIVKILESLGAPVYPSQIGVDKDLVFDSIIVAKEVRDRYTILQFLWDLGIAKEMAANILEWLN